jgi:hypothetical protein
MYMFATRNDQVVPQAVYIQHTSVPINNPNLAFHNYTIHYFPERIVYFVDSFQLASTDLTGYGPSRPLALRLYVKAGSSASVVADVAYVRAVSYQMTNVTTAVCV